LNIVHTLFDGLEDKKKTCTICRQALPLSAFGRDGGANYLRYECKSCARKQSKTIREIKKNASPIPKDHCCPICEMNEQQIRTRYPNKKNVWCCDHNHTTNKFRGWLCHKCNLGLGNFDDDIKRIKNAMQYLTKT